LICGKFDLFSGVVSDAELENAALALGALLLHVQPVGFVGIDHASGSVRVCCVQNTVTYGFPVVAAEIQWRLTSSGA